MTQSGLTVSVAMCTYNGEAFVGAQLESILKQSHPPDEVVVCDDGSSDQTVKIIQELVRAYPVPVRLIQNTKNLGAAKNHEKAINETCGDIIFPSDFDDCWFPDRIATTLPFFERNAAMVLVYCDAVLTDEKLNPVGKTVFSKRRALARGTALAPEKLGRGILFNGPMMVFRSELKRFIVPFSNQWSWDHWVGFLAYAFGEVGRIDRPLLYYRRHGNNRGRDPDLDGGFWHRWQAARKGSNLRNYTQRRRRWEHMLERFRQIRDGSSFYSPQLEGLLNECERCLRFARAREEQKGKARMLRAGYAVEHLVRGDYHRHAHGLKSLVQDVLIK